MRPLPSNPDLLRLAPRVLWFESAEQALADPIRFLTYVMTYATSEEIAVVRRYVELDDFREALEHAPPGIMDERSWGYWKCRDRAVSGAADAVPSYSIASQTVPVSEQLHCSRDWKKQALRTTGKTPEAITGIECRGGLVLCIDDDSEYSGVRPNGAFESIEQQRRPKTSPSILPINSEPSNQGRRDDGIPRQPPAHILRKINNRNARCGQRVVARDGSCVERRCNEAIRDPASHVLPGLRSEIAIKRIHTAREG